MYILLMLLAFLQQVK